ncbi:MAG: AAA family ATPase [Candidatus Melainabacteria bacterium]|nr:AAA family ATPase [Candidatus Melainabacteria bacterium]
MTTVNSITQTPPTWPGNIIVKEAKLIVIPEEESSSAHSIGVAENQDQVAYEPHLRQKIELIQKLKSEADIKNLAAAWQYVFALIPPAWAGAKWLIKNIAARQARSEIDGCIAKAVKSLGGEEYFNDDLLSVNLRTPRRVAKAILEADFNKPKNVMNDVQRAVIQLLGSTQHSQASLDEFLEHKRTARGLLLALEALYLRSDTVVDPNDVKDIFIPYLEKPHEVPLIYGEKSSLDCIRRIITLNWKLPIRGFKIPVPDLKTPTYRMEIYSVMKEFLERAKKVEEGTIEEQETKEGLYGIDPLYLRTPLVSVPRRFRDEVEKFREKLVEAFKNENELGETSPNYHIMVPTTISGVLELSSEIPKAQWNEEAEKLEAQQRLNEKRFVVFKKWANDITPMSNEEARNCFFTSFDNDQMEVLGGLPEDKRKNLLKVVSEFDSYKTKEDLNEALLSLLDLLKLDTEVLGQKLTQNNSEKGLLFFKYLNQLMEKRIAIGNDPPRPYREFVNQENKNRVLQSCRKIVQDTIFFRATPRGYEFFTEPHLGLDSVPAQALALNHKLTRCFNDEEGYVDAHGLKGLVLKPAVRSLYGNDSNSATHRTFLLSGPPGTGKSSLAETIANQLALPLVLLTPGMVTVKKGDVKIKHGEKPQTVSEFIHTVNKTAPCVLLMDEVNKILPPRKGANLNEIPTDAFLSQMEPKGTESHLSTKVVLIMTTNLPLTEEIDVSSIDDKGYSGSIEEQLYKYVDYGVMREGRSDKKIFIFHKLFTEEQGTLFAKRFLEPYVKSRRIKGQVNYAEAGKTVMNYTPATVEKVFEDYVKSTQGQVTQEDMLSELKKRPGVIRYHFDPRVSGLMEGTINSLVYGLKVKKIGTPAPDAKKLAIRVQELNLTDEQFTDAIVQLAPQVLTQENILTAFEKVRKLGS